MLSENQCGMLRHEQVIHQLIILWHMHTKLIALTCGVHHRRELINILRASMIIANIVFVGFAKIAARALIHALLDLLIAAVNIEHHCSWGLHMMNAFDKTPLCRVVFEEKAWFPLKESCFLI